MDGKELRRDSYCFVCGPENPKGMHLKFHKTEDGVYASFSLPKYYQGYEGVVHGGVIALLLDESMAYLQTFEERFLTGRLTVKYHSPLKVGEEVEIRAWIEKERGRTKVTKAVMVKKETKEKVAEAEAIMFVIKE